MEIHTPHHSENPAHKKKWSYYFWEFFLMFSAITASFLVENWREHLSDNKKERQYMVSLFSDLRSDTSQLSYYIQRNKVLVTGLDSLFIYVKGFKSGSSLTTLYRQFDAYATWVSRARLADRAVSQLKNAGVMRLIRFPSISDSILLYEERKRLLIDAGESYRRENEMLADISRKIIDYKALLPFNPDDVPVTQHFNPGDWFEFGNEMKLLKDQIETYIIYLEEMFGRAINLINALQQRYHIS